MGIGTGGPRLVSRESNLEGSRIRPLARLLRTAVIVGGIMAVAFTARADPTRYNVNVRLASVGSNGQAHNCGINVDTNGVKLTKKEKREIAKIICRADKRTERPSRTEILDPFASNHSANGNGTEQKSAGTRDDSDYLIAFQ